MQQERECQTINYYSFLTRRAANFFRISEFICARVRQHHQYAWKVAPLQLIGGPMLTKCFDEFLTVVLFNTCRMHQHIFSPRVKRRYFESAVSRSRQTNTQACAALLLHFAITTFHINQDKPVRALFCGEHLVVTGGEIYQVHHSVVAKSLHVGPIS